MDPDQQTSPKDLYQMLQFFLATVLIEPTAIAQAS